jgi:Neuraminidase (sialidase)
MTTWTEPNLNTKFSKDTSEIVIQPLYGREHQTHLSHTIRPSRRINLRSNTPAQAMILMMHQASLKY